MTLRNILNNCVRILKPYRQFSSLTINCTNKNMYKPSLPVISTPWLMIPSDVKDGPNGPTDNYWNIIDKSIVKIGRPTARGSVPFNTMCVGSAKGWVAFGCDSNGRLFLINPYEARSCELPAPWHGIHREGLHFTLVGDLTSDNFSLISEDRTRCNFSDGIQIINSDGCQPKEFGPKNSISRVAYNRKVNIVYELQLEESGKLQITLWYPLGDNYKYAEMRQVFSLFLDPKVIDRYKLLTTCYSMRHNVEKFLVVTEENNSSLFFVIRHLAKDDDVQCETKDIELFEIDLEGDGKVKHVESIGDKALFLGRNSEPFFISTRDCSRLKSNCVYVADDFGYYDLETKCLTPFLSLGDLSLGDLANIRPQAYWVAPPLPYPDIIILPPTPDKRVYLAKLLHKD